MHDMFIWFIPSSYVIHVSALYLIYSGHCVLVLPVEDTVVIYLYGYDYYAYLVYYCRSR